MTRTALYLIGGLALIIGSLLVGLGIGRLFCKPWEGVLVGLGLGILLVAFISFRIHRRLMAYNKDKL